VDNNIYFIKKEKILTRIGKETFYLLLFWPFFALIAVIIGKEKRLLENLQPLVPFLIITALIGLPFIIYRWKIFVYSIQIKNEGVFLNYLNFNKELYVEIPYNQLDVKIEELVDHSGTIIGYSMRFSNENKKYIINKNGEWNKTQLTSIINDLENKQKTNKFFIDGKHFKKEIF
jgi:hypothetical protein